MYGYEKHTTIATEQQFQEALTLVDSVVTAVEELAELEQRAEAGLSAAEKIIGDGQVKDAITKFGGKLGLEFISNEDFAAGDVFHKAGDVARQLMSWVQNVVTFYIDMFTESRVTAAKMRNRAAAVLGAADTVADTADIGRPIDGARIFNQSNIAGVLCTDIGKQLVKATALVRQMESPDFVTFLNDIVRRTKEGKSPTAEQQKLHAALEQLCKRHLTKVTRHQFAKLGNHHTDTYVSDIYPGNVVLVVHLPKTILDMSQYSCSIQASGKFNGSGQSVNTLAPSEAKDIARTARVFCDYVIQSRNNQADVNRISREIRALATSGKLNDAGKVIRPFAQMTKNPYIMQTRLALTLCSRALNYCEASMRAYDKDAGI